MKVLTIFLCLKFSMVLCDPPKPQFVGAFDPIVLRQNQMDEIKLGLPQRPKGPNKLQVTNGNPAAILDFPYQVLIYMNDGITDDWYTCGGCLIRFDFVLTVKKFYELT